MTNDDIEDIIRQLSDLHLQQTNLLARLETARADEVRRTRSATQANATSEAQQAPRSFAVGDRVRIINPRPLQETRGSITKVGRVRITVTTQSGSKILRAAKNLALE
jgi:hypothetical protein